MSQPVPSVPSGVDRRRTSRASGPRSSTIGVQTGPGAIALTRIPFGASCTATDRTKPITPAFAVAYAVRPTPRIPATDDTQMTEPPPRRSIAGTAVRVARNIDLRSTAITRSHSSSCVSRRSARDSMPTLLWRMSTPPQRRSASATIVRQSSAWVTSAAKAEASPPSPTMVFAVSSARSRAWSTHSTRAPSRAKRMAAALPLPTPGPREPAPVTSATLPFSRSPMARLRRGLDAFVHARTPRLRRDVPPHVLHRLPDGPHVELRLLHDAHSVLPRGLQVLALPGEHRLLQLVGDLPPRGGHDLLGRGRHLLPEPLVEQSDPGHADVVGEVEVLLDLPQLRRVDDLERVLLTFDGAGLERREHLGPRHRCGGGAERAPRRHHGGDLRHADLQALEVGGLQHLDLARGELAGAAVSVAEHAQAPLLDHRPVPLLPDRSVQHLPHVVPIAEHVGQEERVVDAVTGHAGDHHPDRAELHALDHLALAAELAGAEVRDLDLACRPLAHELRQLLAGDRGRVGRGRRAAPLEGERLLFLGGDRGDPGRRRERARGGGGTGEERAAGQHVQSSSCECPPVIVPPPSVDWAADDERRHVAQDEERHEQHHEEG